jgi:hypothetical protein
MAHRRQVANMFERSVARDLIAEHSYLIVGQKWCRLGDRRNRKSKNRYEGS